MTKVDSSSNLTPAYQIVLGFLAIYLIWGSTYLAIRFAIETIPPLFSAGVRFLCGGALLYGYSRHRGARLATKHQFQNTATTGLLLVVGGTGLVTWAEQYVPSGLAALLVAAMPFWMVLIEWLRPGGVRPALSVALGLVVGFVGIMILVGPVQVTGGGTSGLVGAGAVLLATLFWASGSIYSRHIELPDSRLLSVGLQMLVGGVALVFLSIITGEFFQLDLANISLRSLGGLTYLITFGSLAFASYVWLLKVSVPAKVSTYAFVNPVVAVFLGWIIADELINARIIFAATIIVAAVAVITIYKNKKVVKEQNTDVSPPAAVLCKDSLS